MASLCGFFRAIAKQLPVQTSAWSPELAEQGQEHSNGQWLKEELVCFRKLGLTKCPSHCSYMYTYVGDFSVTLTPVLNISFEMFDQLFQMFEMFEQQDGLA